MTNLSQHSENTKRIICYLSYLRDISRKIISRNGFEKCLLNKTLGYAFQFKELSLDIAPTDDNYDEINKYFNFVQRNNDKKLFIGFGTIVGTSKRVFAAPLIIIQCELSKDDSTQNINIEPDFETNNVNYDLISALSTNYLNEEDDVLNPISEVENQTIEKIENHLKSFKDLTVNEFSHYTQEVFDQLKQNLEHFKEIQQLQNEDYDFKRELGIYNYRPSKNANGNEKRSKKEKSLFEQELVFINAHHIYVSQIPDQLSTYEALNTFVKNITEENDFKNAVVEKLLVNALTQSRVSIDFQENETIEEVITNFIPLSPSNSQKQGVRNAWTNEISYIQGPPGTGKSHTISAIVLSAIALNKKVLVISQKPPALQVVNKKIEPYLTDNDGLLGVCYYDKSARKKIKEYCQFLLQKAGNRNVLSNEIKIITKRVSELETRLKSIIKELLAEQRKLETALEQQLAHKEQNDIFLKALARFEGDYNTIPKGFKFKKIKNFDDYGTAIERIEQIYSTASNSLATKLFIHKFKEHLKSKFATPDQWMERNDFPYFSKDFIHLNNIFTEVQENYRVLNADTNSIRKRIKNLKEDIFSNQKQLVKFKYRLNVYSFIVQSNYQNEIDKFDRMLYNTNSRIIDNKMQEIDFRKITDTIPFWTAEIRHLGHLFPLQPDIFDLVVVDESSQVNLAEIIPAFYRGAKICIVGDHHQLSLKASGLNFHLSKSFDQMTWEKYNRTLQPYQIATRKKLTVTQASILDFIKSEEYNAAIREVMLDEHFRSLPHLAKYTSKEFYKDEDNPDGKLKIMTETPDKLAINCFKAIRVNGTRDAETKMKHIVIEAEEVIKIIQHLISGQTLHLFKADFHLPDHINKESFTIGVISMIREQCDLINDLAQEKLPNDVWTKYELMIGTPEEFQGNERDVIIFTLCLDINCIRGQGHYQDAKRLNVATSRAKAFTYFVYSPFPKSFNKIYNYLNYLQGKVTEEDTMPVTAEDIVPTLPPLNPEAFESDFERYVYHYLDKFVNKNSINGNKLTLHNQLKSCGQKRLDFVIYNHTTKKSAAVEVDGSYHFAQNGLSENYTLEHVERMEILTRAGWNIINTPYHKWYKEGWLSEEEDKNFKEEIERIFAELTKYLF